MTGTILTPKMELRHVYLLLHSGNFRGMLKALNRFGWSGSYQQVTFGMKKPPTKVALP